MAASGKGYALRNQLRCGAICGRYRGNNTLVKDSAGEAGSVVVTDLLFGASSGQTVTPDLLTNLQNFYAPTVTVGAVTISPARLDNAQSFYAPTVTQVGPDQTVTPSLVSNSQSFYAPTVSVSGGPQTITPGRLTDGQTFYAPTVTPGAVTVSPGLLTNSQSFYAPTVYDPDDLPPPSIRFDISTGKLVKILSPAVCISF